MYLYCKYATVTYKCFLGFMFWLKCCCYCSIFKSCPTLWPHGLQHARLTCPSLSSGVCSNSCPLSQWCYLAISCTVTPSPLGNIRVFSNELSLHIRWPKYWSFNFSTSPSKKDSGLISLRVDWFHLLAVQGTLKSLFQHHSSKASILWHPAFFMVQLSQLYMTTRKTIALTKLT